MQLSMEFGVRDTSREAYHALCVSGQKHTDESVVYMSVFRCAKTRLQVSRDTGLPINNVCGRVNKLLKLGYLKEDGLRVDEITGRKSYVLKVEIF